MIEINNLGYVYPCGREALKNININIKKGESVALVGANGAGKSTMLSILVGIFENKSGTVKIDEVLLSKKNLVEIRKKVGMVFQNPDDQLFMPRVYDDIAFGLKNLNFTEIEVKQRVEEIMETFDITHLKDRMSHKLSGGEKRTCAIAAVLAMNPDVLALDEPSCFLDPKARRQMIKTLASINLTKIVATHDLDMVLELCDRVIVLKDGEVYADGKPDEILMDEKILEECSLELPLGFQRCRNCKNKI